MDAPEDLEQAASLLQEALGGSLPPCTPAEADEATRLQALRRACPALRPASDEELAGAALTLPLTEAGLRRLVWRTGAVTGANLSRLLTHPATTPALLVRTLRTLQGAEGDVRDEGALLLRDHEDPHAQVMGRLLLVLDSPASRQVLRGVRDDAELDEALEGALERATLDVLLTHATRHEADLAHLVLALGPHGRAGWEVLTVLVEDLLASGSMRPSRVVDLALEGAVGVLARR